MSWLRVVCSLCISAAAAAAVAAAAVAATAVARQQQQRTKHPRIELHRFRNKPDREEVGATLVLFVKRKLSRECCSLHLTCEGASCFRSALGLFQAMSFKSMLLQFARFPQLQVFVAHLRTLGPFGSTDRYRTT